MQRGEDVAPKLFTDASVFFCDIVNFQIMAMESEPMEIVKLLNDIYVKFDEVIARFKVYKVRRAVTCNKIIFTLMSTSRYIFPVLSFCSNSIAHKDN